VEAFGSTLSSEAGAILAESDGQLTQCQTILGSLEGYGTPVTNPYTTHSTASLRGLRGDLAGHLEEQKAVFVTELERQKHNDTLCLAFAKTVDPFVASIRQYMQVLTSPEDSLDAQLLVIEDALQKAEQEPVRAKLHNLDDQIQAAGCTFNPHVRFSFRRRRV